MSPSNNFKGSIAMIAGMGLYMLGDVAMKTALATYPLFEVQVVRGIASILVCLTLIFAMGDGHHLRQILNPWVAARGLCEVGASFSFYLAISYLPLADVTAIVQTCPLLILVGTWLFWGEKLGMKRLSLVVLGISGALLVAQPGTTAASSYALLGFVAALSVATRDLLIRKAPTDIPPLVAAMPLLIAVTTAATICTLFFEVQVALGTLSLLSLVLSGLLVVSGHASVFLAYKIAPAKSVAPFMYSLTVWAVLIGIFFFGDIPNLLAFAGMAMIITAGLAILWLDSRNQQTAP